LRAPLDKKVDTQQQWNPMRASANSLESELWADELAYLKGLLGSGELKDTHLEIGTAAGGTLKEMMACYDNDSRPTFMVVDPMQYFPDQLQKVKQNLANRDIDPETVDFRIGKSQELFEQVSAEGVRFDFMLIDGNHKIRYVTRDLQWTRLLNPGGILCLHDYNSNQKGVMWSANRFMRKNTNYERIALVDSLLVLHKRSESKNPEINGNDRLWSELMAPILQWERNIKKRLA
jgi:predicted O-methyltransferase YrrM